jgi:hypothetical protein
MMTPTEIRLGLFHNGYNPLPLVGKNPNINGENWQIKRRQTNPEEIKLWAEPGGYPHATNTGMLTRHVPTLDIDIRDKDAAEASEALVAEQFDTGRVLVRIGLSPKRAIPFRTDEPFAKISETLIAPNGDEHKIEFLGDGQQVVVDGTHPDTKLPYRWYGGELTAVHRDNLPEIDYERARKLVDDIVALLIEQHGYRRKKGREESKSEKSDGRADWGGSHEGTNWGGFFTGDPLDHDMLCSMAMSLMVGGLSDGCTYNILYARITTAQGVNEERRSRRLHELPGIIRSARAKLGERKEQTSPLIRSSKEFAATFTPPDYLVNRLLIQSFLYALTGQTGSGKTAIALRLAASVALGSLFAGLTTSPRRVLYLAAENPIDVQMRWIALAQQMDFDADAIPVFFVEGVFKISEMAAKLKTEAERVGGDFGLVIIDAGPAFYEGDEANSRTQQFNHARMLRDLINIIPGKPTVLANVHPVKHADEDNLLPAGGGTFLNEIDGNLTAAKNDATVEVHWQGKMRGIEFAPLNFLIKSVTHERLKDKNGQLIPTVICEWLSERAKEDIETAAFADQKRLLGFMHDNPKASLAELATKMDWKLHDGGPHKMRVKRAANAMIARKLLKKNALQEWEITEAGLTLLGRKSRKAAGTEEAAA